MGWWLSESLGNGGDRLPPASASIADEVESAAKPREEPEPDAEVGSDEMVIRTRRQGAHHVVDAELFGPAGGSVEVELVVDTGASLLVLPASLIDQLGIDPLELEPGRAQTARGVVRTQLGRLDRVSLMGEGDQVASDDVEVAFVRDGHLGGMALLGMSFLGRFRLMIDDAEDSITLIERY
ncbi:MAG: retropepsin-like aspartic protease [Alphaproteobacteria bacterium]|nr:retropepsin-like aspartic protease [Alphaproteobacteria bacterium]